MTSLRKAGIAVQALAVFGMISTAHAASSAVSISITFEVAPIELLRTRGIAPQHHRSCERLREKIELLWEGRIRAPQVDCRSDAQMPLIVSLNTVEGVLVARP